MKMSQPTQDTDITSSISPSVNVPEDRFNENLGTGNNVEKFVQGRHPNSLMMENLYSDDNKNSENNGMAEYQGSELVKSLGDSFPWLLKFSKVIQSAVGSKNPKLLDRLLFVYVQNMSRDVNTCYTKPHRAAKVKTHINDTLIFFHLYWKNIKEKVDDHNQYLDKMSEILAMYVDMELKASRRGKDSASKIAAKLLTAMFIYLDNSEEHIIRILLRAKFVTKNYSQICGPIFKKLFTGLSSGRKSITVVTYVRYLLALKLWKRIKDDSQEKKKINELAIAILGQRTPVMNNELSKIISKPPEAFKSGTLWLLQPNSFDLRQACDLFIQYELNERITSLPESIERLKIVNSVDTPSTQINSAFIDRLQQKDIPQSVGSVNTEQVKRVIKLRRFKPSFPKLKPGEVVFIDLTAENEESKSGDVKKKKKRDKKKLKWLKEVSKKLKLKKQSKSVEKNWVEKADAHSTEDNNEGLKRSANNRPISDDKITKSTERIPRFAKKIFEYSENVVTSQTSPALNNDSIVLSSSEFSKGESHHGEAAPREIFLNHIKQEPNDSVAHSSTIISESRGSYYITDKKDCGTANKMIKREWEDIIDDSTTVINCDKVILTDSSSFNITKKPVTKLKTEEKDAENVNMPLPSYGKSVNYSSETRGKVFKAKERMNESCVVSTTASVFDSEQIKVISRSTNENYQSRLFNINNNTSMISKTSKILKSGDMSKNDTLNNKLQNSLIHALSLDQMIQIGKDDVDSQSDDDEDKEINKSQCKKFTNPNEDDDLLQIPELQLCDDFTNSNEVEDLVTKQSKSKVDEFENIDILDSILNGDMSMQEILEEQHLSMSSASNDMLHNTLGFFTEFFKQSEVTLNTEGDCNHAEALHLDKVTKSLPEGSLGMTGILNSLFDSDLTSIDSPPSDFMYSNVQSVDPRLIRKSPTAERAAFLHDFSNVSDLFSQKEPSAEGNFTGVESLSKKTKDQLFLDQKDSLNCNDLEEFGLNDTKETAFEMPVLEEELIQLPPDPLIDDTIITPPSCELPASEDKSTENYHHIQLTENSYEYSKLNNFQELTSLRLKDIIQHSPPEIVDHSEDLPTSTLTDFTPPQSVDPPQSPYTFTSSPAPSQTYCQVPHSPTHAVTISRHSISANMLTPPPSGPQLLRQNNLTPPPTPQQNQSKAVNLQKSRIRCLSMNSQSSENDLSSRMELASSLTLQKKATNETTKRKADRKIISVVHNFKKNSKARTASNTVDNAEEQGVRLAQVKVALTRLTRDEIHGRTSGEQSLLKSNILVNRETMQRQLQNPKTLNRIDLREFGIASQQNKSVLINLNGKTKPALVFERNVNTEGDNVNRSSNIVYKLTSNVKPATSNDTPYSKLQNVNFTVQSSQIKDIMKNSKSTITRRDVNVETSKETQKIMRPRCSARRVKTQASKSSVNEINARKNMNISTTEEPSMKKRKIATKFSQLIQNKDIIYTVNQQKAQEKHSSVLRRDYSRKERTKKKVV